MNSDRNETSRRGFLSACGLGAAALAAGPVVSVRRQAHAADAKPVVDLGNRWELFVDEWLVDAKTGVAHTLNHPQKAEVVLVTDAAWEGPTSGYYSVTQDGDIIRLYYRGYASGSDLSENQVTCMAESRDGVNFTRPKLGIVEIDGSAANNVVWKGIESHNFAAFRDTNPDCKPEERYKGLGGIRAEGTNWKGEKVEQGLYAFASPDGVHWHKMEKRPVMTKGAFDSLNLAFWDAARGRYACYSRIFTDGVRAVQSSHSSDFVGWSDAVPNRYAEGVPMEHFYTTGTVACPGAEHLLLAFPKRFLPKRKKVAEHSDTGVSDAVFMSSRDGVNWDRPFLEAWVRPGLDPKNWTERSNMPAWGIVEATPGEWSLYISEHYRWPDNRLRRLVLPRHRLASLQGGAQVGEFTTRPVTFDGKELTINYSTSAAGSVQIEIQNADGEPITGFAQADMAPLYGDELDAVVAWKSGSDLTKLKGRPVRLRVALHDADLFALRFA